MLSCCSRESWCYGSDPEQQALLAEGVGLALVVVLDTLAPAERLAFVLHDMFAVPFGQIAPILGDLLRRRPASWPAGPAAGCGAPPRPRWRPGPPAAGRGRFLRRRPRW